jgi:hypothetical protein
MPAFSAVHEAIGKKIRVQDCFSPKVQYGIQKK